MLTLRCSFIFFGAVPLKSANWLRRPQRVSLLASNPVALTRPTALSVLWSKSECPYPRASVRLNTYFASRSPAKRVKTTARISTGGRRPRKELLSPVTITYAICLCLIRVVTYLTCSAPSETVPARRRLRRALSFGELSGDEIEAVVSAACSRASTPAPVFTQVPSVEVDALLDLEADESDGDDWCVPFFSIVLCNGLTCM